MEDFIYSSGQAVHVTITVLGLLSLWGLWIARRENKLDWDNATKQVWWIHAIFASASIERHSELFYRHETPTLSAALTAGALAWTVRGVFNGNLYRN